MYQNVCLKTQLFLDEFETGRWAKLFAIVDGRKLRGAKITLHVYSIIMINQYLINKLHVIYSATHYINQWCSLYNIDDLFQKMLLKFWRANHLLKNDCRSTKIHG